jgi:hypothetical protein
MVVLVVDVAGVVNGHLNITNIHYNHYHDQHSKLQLLLSFYHSDAIFRRNSNHNNNYDYYYNGNTSTSHLGVTNTTLHSVHSSTTLQRRDHPPEHTSS